MSSCQHAASITSMYWASLDTFTQCAGTILMLALDFLPPQEPETWHYLRLEDGRSLKLSGDAIAMNMDITTGTRVRVQGTLNEPLGSGMDAKQQQSHGEKVLLVSHVQVLPAAGV